MCRIDMLNAGKKNTSYREHSFCQCRANYIAYVSADETSCMIMRPHAFVTDLAHRVFHIMMSVASRTERAMERRAFSVLLC